MLKVAERSTRGEKKEEVLAYIYIRSVERVRKVQLKDS